VWGCACVCVRSVLVGCMRAERIDRDSLRHVVARQVVVRGCHHIRFDATLLFLLPLPSMSPPFCARCCAMACPATFSDSLILRAVIFRATC